MLVVTELRQRRLPFVDCWRLDHWMVETLRSGRQLRWQKRCLCWDLNLAYLLDVLEFLSKTTLIRRYNQTCGGSCMEIIDYHPFLAPCVHCPSRFVIL